MGRSLMDTVDISDGDVYEGYVDLTAGGYQSPTFLINILPSEDGPCVVFETDFLYTTHISGTAFAYMTNTNTWHEMDIDATHNFINHHKVIMANSVARFCSNFYIQIYKEGTDVNTFTYRVYQGALND